MIRTSLKCFSCTVTQSKVTAAPHPAAHKHSGLSVQVRLCCPKTEKWQQRPSCFLLTSSQNLPEQSWCGGYEGHRLSFKSTLMAFRFWETPPVWNLLLSSHANWILSQINLATRGLWSWTVTKFCYKVLFSLPEQLCSAERGSMLQI